MPTQHQTLGVFGEDAVVKNCFCGRCKRERTLRKLPPNFRCADVICDFCGFLAQVKTTTVQDHRVLPDRILGAAWGPQKDRMDAGIFIPLFLVLKASGEGIYSIFYLSADLQTREIFIERKPLAVTARRAGWQGFYYNLRSMKDRFVQLR